MENLTGQIFGLDPVDILDKANSILNPAYSFACLTTVLADGREGQSQ